MAERAWVQTDDPNDPCALCVQWRCELCKQPDCPEDCPAWPGGMGTEYEPYWPDGSVVPQVYGGIHDDCQRSVVDYIADHANDADHQVAGSATPTRDLPFDPDAGMWVRPDGSYTVYPRGAGSAAPEEEM